MNINQSKSYSFNPFYKYSVFFVGTLVACFSLTLAIIATVQSYMAFKTPDVVVIISFSLFAGIVFLYVLYLFRNTILELRIDSEGICTRKHKHFQKIPWKNIESINMSSYAFPQGLRGATIRLSNKKFSERNLFFLRSVLSAKGKEMFNNIASEFEKKGVPRAKARARA